MWSINWKNSQTRKHTTHQHELVLGLGSQSSYFPSNPSFMGLRSSVPEKSVLDAYWQVFPNPKRHISFNTAYEYTDFPLVGEKISCSYQAANNSNE